MKQQETIDFIGIGAPKSASTWISVCLEKHPGAEKLKILLAFPSLTRNLEILKSNLTLIKRALKNQQKKLLAI